MNLKLVNRVFDDVVLYFSDIKYRTTSFFFNCRGYLNYRL